MQEVKYESVSTGEQRVVGQMLNATVSGRPMFASVDVDLQGDQAVVARTGTLLTMDTTLQMSTWCHGGCWQGLQRHCAGESFCMNTYAGTGKVGFHFPVPGDVMCFGVTPGNGWILSKGAFLSGSHNLKVNARFAGFCACLFSGEGPFLTHVECGEGGAPGMFFAGGFGSIVRHDVAPGAVLLVEHGLFFAAHENTKLRVRTFGGLKTFCCSGEGFVMRFQGPCTVFTQSRDPSLLREPEDKQVDGDGGGSPIQPPGM